MKYQNKRIDGIVLKNGIYKGIEYYIVSYGTHPCAYIRLTPKFKRYFGKKYNETEYYFNLYCNGGCTYSKEYLPFDNNFKKRNSWYIGWDYGHSGDYVGYYIKYCKGKSELSKLKKWNAIQIFEEVKDVINQLLEGIKYDK